MDLNNNQMLLIGVVAVALYFFMKYKNCSNRENFATKVSKSNVLSCYHAMRPMFKCYKLKKNPIKRSKCYKKVERICHIQDCMRIKDLKTRCDVRHRNNRIQRNRCRKVNETSCANEFK